MKVKLSFLIMIIMNRNRLLLLVKLIFHFLIEGIFSGNGVTY